LIDFNYYTHHNNVVRILSIQHLELDNNAIWVNIPWVSEIFSLSGGQGVEQQSCQSELRSSEKARRPALCSLLFLQLVSEKAFGIQGRVGDFTIIYFSFSK